MLHVHTTHLRRLYLRNREMIYSRGDAPVFFSTAKNGLLGLFPQLAVVDGELLLAVRQGQAAKVNWAGERSGLLNAFAPQVGEEVEEFAVAGQRPRLEVARGGGRVAQAVQQRPVRVQGQAEAEARHRPRAGWAGNPPSSPTPSRTPSWCSRPRRHSRSWWSGCAASCAAARRPRPACTWTG